jgi:hypothetical protein
MANEAGAIVRLRVDGRRPRLQENAIAAIHDAIRDGHPYTPLSPPARTRSEFSSVKVSAAKFVNAWRIHQVGAATAPQNVAQRRSYSDQSKAERRQQFLRDGNHPPPLRYGAASSRPYFRSRRFGFAGNQLAQEWNQHNERDTDREAAGAKLHEELRVTGIAGDRCGAGLSTASRLTSLPRGSRVSRCSRQ